MNYRRLSEELKNAGCEGKAGRGGSSSGAATGICRERIRLLFEHRGRRPGSERSHYRESLVEVCPQPLW